MTSYKGTWYSSMRIICYSHGSHKMWEMFKKLKNSSVGYKKGFQIQLIKLNLLLLEYLS